MLSRGSYKAALAELDEVPETLFPSCDALSNRDTLEAYAYEQLGRHADAVTIMSKAATHCANPSPLVVADLAMRKAQISDSPTEAEKCYRQVLEIARQQRDPFREAGALLNLGTASAMTERYDESIARNEASLSISRANGYKRYEGKAEGNLAFDFDKLGDFDRALALSNEAEQSARTLDDGHDMIRWRNNIGLLHEELGQLAAAESDYRQALSLARKQEDENQTTIALDELAFL